MRIPLAFPNFDDSPPDFMAFALLSGTIMESVATGEIESKQGLITLWLATRPEVTSEVIVFTNQLNKRLEGSNMLERLNLPANTEFRAAGVRYTNPDGSRVVEMMCVGLHIEGLEGPPPDTPAEAESDFNDMVAEAAAEAGFLVTPSSNKDGEVIVESPGIDAALRHQVDKKIEAEAAKFRAELDSVFDTWKGGTNQ